MSGYSNLAWVTAALDDGEVQNALRLCYSLRRTCTPIKLVLIVSDLVTEHLKKAARRAFDCVFLLDNKANTAGIELADFAKLYGICTLASFEACVYLSPTMLVLKNLDEIFGLLNTKICIFEKHPHVSLFAFKPSNELYDELITFAEQNPGATFYDMVLNNGVTYFPSSYDKKIVNGKPFHGSPECVSIVDLADYPTDKSLISIKKAGLFGNLVAEYWHRIQTEDVATLLEGNKTPSIPPCCSPESQLLKRCSKENPIAIVGMSCRYPLANNLEEFWDLLIRGVDAMTSVPETRWTDVLRGKGGRKRESYKPMNAGFLKVPVDEFDASFFGISPQEVVLMDPQHRLLLELVWEALEHACINPHSLHGTVGSVFVGSWQNDYNNILSDSGVDNFYRCYMGNCIGAMAARISFLLGMTGPNVATESGCSSSMVAVHMALKSLRSGETNLALACGVNLLLEPFDEDTVSLIFSPDGRCKPFSADANGFGRADGAGVLVLKRMSDAIKDGDCIWGLIRGSAISQEGLSKSMGTPTLVSETLAMKNALKDAKVSPDQVSYVEAHGTGTPVGDPVEVAAIANVYGSRKKSLVIGSVKGNVGHTESCSGITGIMKTVLAMHHETIPQQVNMTQLNPAIKLESIPAVLPLEKMPWKKTTGTPRLAGVSSHGITGTDAHVILEEPPQTPFPTALTVKQEMERPVHLLKLSAKTQEAMDIMLENYKNALETMEYPLADIAYSANVGRADFPVRAAIVGKNANEMVDMIDMKKYLCDDDDDTSSGKICFLFTGQGSQYPGMARMLYEHSPIFQTHFDFCSNILQDEYNVDINTILWSGNNADVSRTIYSQTSIFCVEYALLKLWESWGVKPDYVLGHSLGEFAASVCAGIISVEDAVKLVAERSKLIDNLPVGKMLVIKASQSRVESLMNRCFGEDASKWLDYAAVNSSTQTVVAGDTELILEFSEFCTQNELKCIILDASHAFHSKHMNPILSIYRDVATTVKMGSVQKCEYISGLKGDLVSADAIDAQYWVDHTRNKVDFLNASRKAVELGCKTFIEIGPQPVLSALTMMNSNEKIACLPSLKRNEEEWSTILYSLGNLYVKGIEINWQGLDQFYARQKVQLPTYPFVRQRFWPELTHTIRDNIHPLLGYIIPNASSSKLFQSKLNLNSSHEYIKDHSIGDTVVFPGAGYLEMCLAAGLATLNMTRTGLPVKLENLSIQAPLALEEGKTTVLQTVAHLSDFSGTEGSRNALDITIHQRVVEKGNAEKWLQHASGTFSPLLQLDDRNYHFDLNNFLDLISKPSDLTNFYQKAAKVGLNFGPQFQSLEAVWTSTDNTTFIARIKNPGQNENDESKYVVHPITLDAMIQAIFCFSLGDKLRKKLYVPVKIGKFVWLSPGKSDSKDMYVYVYNPNPGENANSQDCTALLLDACGAVLAVMSGLELVATLLKTLESIFVQQTSPLPDLWDNTMQGERGSAYGFSNHENCCIEETPSTETYNAPPELQKLDDRISELVYLQILRCFYQCGFQPVENAIFTTDQLRGQLQVGEEFTRLFRQFICILEEEGVLKNINGDKWQVVHIPPPLEFIEQALRSPIFTEKLVEPFRSTSLIRKLGENMKEILTGQIHTLPILFPEQQLASKQWSSVDDFYGEYAQVYPIYKLMDNVVRQNLEICKKQHEGRGERYLLRVCELGAGTGIGTQMMLKNLDELGIEYEYTFTDISSAYFNAAEKKFSKYLDNLIFKTLDLENDPLEQGFAPAYYDLVLAVEVVHATRNLRESLNHINMLLKPNGRLVLCDQSKVSRLVLSIFGYLEGFWRYEDTELRQHSCVLPAKKWVDILDGCGLFAAGIYASYKNYHTLFICKKVCDIGDVLQNQKLVSPDISRNKAWIVLHEEGSSISNFISQNICKLTNRQVVIVTRAQKYHVSGSDLFGAMTTATVNENDESDYKKLVASLQKNDQVSSIEGIVYCWALDRNKITQDNILKPLLHLSKAVLSTPYSPGLKLVALTNGAAAYQQEGCHVTHYQSSTVTGFLKSLSTERTDLVCQAVDVGGIEKETELIIQIIHELWGSRKENEVAYCHTTRYVPQIKKLKPAAALSELKFPPGVDRFHLVLPDSKQIEDLQFGTLAPFELEEGHIEIQVKACALNFRDVLSVLKPSEDFRNSNTIGFDFAGTVSRIGTQVTKWKVGDRVFGINLEGDSLPSHIPAHEHEVFEMPDSMTYAEASTIPVVLATCVEGLVNIAKIRASDTVLIHTASGGVGLLAIQICKHVGATMITTAGSQRKQNYLRNLGILQVFNSRNTDFEKEIMKVTKGRGVDVVLNSLTSKGFKEATLNCCAKNARFVEISRLNIWTPEEVRQLRPDVSYTVNLLTRASSRLLLVAGKKLLEGGVIQPIPYVRFDVSHIREALQYLQQSRHVGKVVCVMPDLRREHEVQQIPMFHENATYLITGGLGGIGFLICKWMLEKGARYVILAGRNSPDKKMQEEITTVNLKYHGAHVVAVQLDVSNFEACRNLIQDQIPVLGYPGIRVVFHAAGCLQDALVENQTWTRFEDTFAPKVNGTVNLHELTKDNPRMEYFVLFSSMGAVLGPPGQSNYAAANKFEDAFAHFRYSLGLPATSVNWGQWGEVGLATEYDFPGMKPITNLQCIAALEYALKSQKTQLLVNNVESVSTMHSYYPNVGLVLEKGTKNNNMTNSSKSSLVYGDQYWQKYHEFSNSEDKYRLLEATVKDIVRNILKLKQTDEINSTNDLQEIGVDSIVFVEIRNALQNLLHNNNMVTLSTASLQDCRSVHDFAETLTFLVKGKEAQSDIAITSEEKMIELLKEDCQLPEYIRPMPEQKRVKVEEISVVLVTGVTGTLGPYVLKELCSTPQISKIICLVRPGRDNSPEERLKNTMEERGLLSDVVDLSRVQAVAGDLASPNLGLDSETWKELCDNVDAIFHLAAYVSHVESYKKRESGAADSRAINVEGTRLILELASSGKKVKHVCNASTLLAATAARGQDGNLAEEWPTLDDYLSNGVTTLAYPNSKFAADMLMKEAVKRGIPGKSFRFPSIAGDSKTGRFVLQQNHLMMRFVFYLKHGVTFDSPTPIPLLPVDICAWTTVKVMLHPDAEDTIYNVSTCPLEVDTDFVNVAKKLGYELKILGYSEMVETLKRETRNGSPFGLYLDFYKTDAETTLKNFPVTYNWMRDETSNKNFFTSRKIKKYFPELFNSTCATMDHIHRDMLFAKKKGWI